MPKTLELMLEPTVENHNQNFLDNWYSQLNIRKAALLWKTTTSESNRQIKKPTLVEQLI